MSGASNPIKLSATELNFGTRREDQLVTSIEEELQHAPSFHTAANASTAKFPPSRPISRLPSFDDLPRGIVHPSIYTYACLLYTNSLY